MGKILDFAAGAVLALVGVDLLYLLTAQLVEVITGSPHRDWVHLYMSVLRLATTAALAVGTLIVATIPPLRRGVRRRHWLALALAGPLLAADIVLQATAGVTAPAAADAHSRQPLMAEHQLPLVVGHAGAWTQCPENTLPCYRLALAHGASALEADLRVLGDGTLVMFHDPDTQRVAGEFHRLHDIHRPMLEELDAGWGFTPDGGETYPWRGQGVRIPTFQQFLDAFPDVPVLLDVKEDSKLMVRALYDFVRHELTASDRARLHIKTNDDALARRLRRMHPRVHVALTQSERARVGIALRLGVHPHRLPHFPPSWVDLNFHKTPNARQVIHRVAGWAREHGHVLTVSTVDDPDEMEALLSIPGLDGLVTNRPARMRTVLVGAPQPMATGADPEHAPLLRAPLAAAPAAGGPP